MDKQYRDMRWSSVRSWLVGIGSLCGQEFSDMFGELIRQETRVLAGRLQWVGEARKVSSCLQPFRSSFLS